MKSSVTASQTELLQGLAASPGIVVGRALVLGEQQWEGGAPLRDAAEVEVEEQRLRRAVALAGQGLEELQITCRASFRQFVPLIAGHLLILEDPLFVERARCLIGEHMVPAETALRQALAGMEEQLAGLSDQYLRERVADVRHVANLIAARLAGAEQETVQDDPVILVGHAFSPEDVLAMDPDLVLGFVNELGGRTDHTAIVARTSGLPAVVGCAAACRRVASGDLLVLDGNRGRVLVNPDSSALAACRQEQAEQERQQRELAFFAHLPAETRQGRKITIEANLEMLEEVEPAMQYGAAGIGLFRSEFYYLTPDGPPSEELLLSIYSHLLVSFNPFPVTVRTLDVGGDKPIKGYGGRPEKNPALGLRAIRLSLQQPELFISQLRALFRAAEHGTLRIMLPMITSYNELLAAKALVRQVRDELRSQGLPHGDGVEIGMMVEVPSAVAIADSLAREVDFFSIGTNDLIQYAMAVDRGNEQVAHMYTPLHPAILRMIAQVVEAGHAAGIEVGLCGEMAGDAAILPVLLGLGLDELSMPPLAIPRIKKMVRLTDVEQAEELAAELLACPATEALQERLKAYLHSHYGLEWQGMGHETGVES